MEGRLAAEESRVSILAPQTVPPRASDLTSLNFGFRIHKTMGMEVGTECSGSFHTFLPFTLKL